MKLLLKRVAPLLYFLAVSLPHHPFSKWFDKAILDPWGHDGVERLADVLSVVVLTATLAFGIRIVRVHRGQAIRHFAAWFVLLLLMYAADRFLIVNGIERIHFPQYAILALLLGLSLRSEILILFVTTFAGFVDEFLQYVMDPMKTNYLDFNDTLFNTLGAALGAVILTGLRKTSPSAPGKTRYEAMFLNVFRISMAVSGVIVLITASFGKIIALLEQKIDRSAFAIVDGKLSFILSFERHDVFWMKAYFGKVFHVMSPAEGLVTIALLTMATLYAIQWLKSSRNQRVLGNGN